MRCCCCECDSAAARFSRLPNVRDHLPWEPFQSKVLACASCRQQECEHWMVWLKVRSFAAPALQWKRCFGPTVFVCATLWTVLSQAD